MAQQAWKVKCCSMLDPSKKLIYAIESIIYIACNGKAKPLRSKEIAKCQHVPHRYLEQVMQRLVHAGLLRGVRGPRGGYLLGKERRRITLGDIARVVNAMDNADDRDISCEENNSTNKIVKPLWEEMHNEFLKRLDKITIEDLYQKENRLGVKHTSNNETDFTI